MNKYRTDLIQPPKPGDDKYFGDVATPGIMEAVLYADDHCAPYTKAFALTLKGRNLLITCRNIFEFVKTMIPYKLDKPGYQWIKSPGRLFADKEGDCKSFSLFIASCLKNLKIPYGYRFTSYDDDPTPTHVYVYVPLKTGEEIIIDPVWTGPFNTQKKFTHKKDYLMAKTYYLGSTGIGTTQNRIPGTLKFNKPLDQVSEAEMDLMLMEQAAEIDKMNKQRIGASTYEADQALKVIRHCKCNLHRPEVIEGIGLALEQGYDVDAAISGKKKKVDPATGKKKKTAAGKLLQKVAKTAKKTATTVAKVVTFPARTIAKGILEIQLPKSAPFFLYLFTPAEAKLPDVMARKKKKAEKLKNFIVKGIGMKENHFMQIIRNNLTKRFGKSPESYLAEVLKKRVSGIGNPKARQRAMIAALGDPGKKKKAKVKNIAPRATANYNSTLKSPVPPTTAKFAAARNVHRPLPAFAPVNPTRQNVTDLSRPADVAVPKKLFNAEDIKTGANLVKKAAQGDLIGAGMAAITWIIEKISALFKGEKAETITPEDFPDVERDAANAFEWQDMKEDYSNLNPVQKETVKEVATELIQEKVPAKKAEEIIEQKLPFLKKEQVKEVVEEVEEGPEALDQSEGHQLAKEIKTEGMNKTQPNKGFCNC